jgi:hypothetical protein
VFPAARYNRAWPQGRQRLDGRELADPALGTDYPFDMGITDPVERAAAAGLPAADLTAILSGNAATLFTLTPG